MRALLPCVPFLLLLPACGGDGTDAQAGSSAVTIYCALDQQFSDPLLKQFEAEAGLSIKKRYDSEASKTVGLFSAIVEEAARPRCDVFWNNELANTVLLAQKGLLAPYESPNAKDIPAQYRDPQHRWTGFGARARILVVNTELLPDQNDWPRSIWAFTEAKWKGRCAVAKPVTGTTLTHFTALRKTLGEQDYDKLIDGMFANEVRFLQSNGATLNETAAGNLAFALTDTDDYNEAVNLGKPVACVFPDQGDGQIGTMLIPNAVAVIKNGPSPAAAHKLVDLILSRSTEAALAQSGSAQLPVRDGIPGPKNASIPARDAFRHMPWDVDWTASHLPETLLYFEKRLH